MGTIVCAVDDTPEAKEALRVAARLSEDTGLRLVVVHVVDTPGAGANARQAAQHSGRQLVERLLAAHGLNDGGADTRVEVGERVGELARVAAEEAASMVVLGSSHGHRWTRRQTSRLTSDLAATTVQPVVIVPRAPRG